eukprot:TRINITY_DN58259_c0_g1_i2.p2 TRINITY_DN58259_c0_g1~~TRINITY_DN58259_c0_g1_i2.p2  ORF type:complete len:158 (-),score=22.31 TRINITY_DN58259_c0_g1_i2:32-505(-)
MLQREGYVCVWCRLKSCVSGNKRSEWGRGVGGGIFFFKQKTAYEMQRGLVGSEMCIRDSLSILFAIEIFTTNSGFLIKHFPDKGRFIALIVCLREFLKASNINFIYLKAKRRLSGKGICTLSHVPVSYTHLTLPTILLVQISVVAVSLKKKQKQQNY